MRRQKWLTLRAHLKDSALAAARYDKLGLESLGHYHIEFDISYLFPQPQPGYWAVVGGFVSDQNIPNSYVAAVRLVCPDFAKVACWRLEKLAINETIVLDRGEPL